MGRRVAPPKIGDKVWVCIQEHTYEKYWYPELYEGGEVLSIIAPAPAEAEVKRLDFFDTKCNLKPTVVCSSNLRGNPNNMHYIQWPRDLGRTMFYTKEECVAKCNEIAGKKR